MKKSDLIERLSSASENEVWIEIDDVLYDIGFGHEDAKFDGFCTAYDEAITLKPKQE